MRQAGLMESRLPDVRKIEAEGNRLKFLSDENMSQDTDTTDPTDSDSALHTHS